jgi:hypothetical protein
MSNESAKIPEWLKPWIEAKKRHRLSQVHIQMARELGVNPRKLGKLDNHRQQAWKAPLPVFIESIYFRQFGKERPDNVRSFLELAAAEKAKKAAKKMKREARKERHSGDLAQTATRLNDRSAEAAMPHRLVSPAEAPRDQWER